jgi:hypothetical protein
MRLPRRYAPRNDRGNLNDRKKGGMKNAGIQVID